MPLKSPSELPKIPKTRKKKAEAALKAIPQPKPDKIEFVCKAYFKFDKVTKRQYYALKVETIQEFTTFAYELTVDVIREKKEIYLVVMGISAKTNIVPGVQPAFSEVLFDEIIGENTVSVVKQDGSINSAVYNFNIFKKEIELLKEFKPKKKNNRLFCKFEVDADSFTFG